MAMRTDRRRHRSRRDNDIIATLEGRVSQVEVTWLLSAAGVTY